MLFLFPSSPHHHALSYSVGIGGAQYRSENFRVDVPKRDRYAPKVEPFPSPLLANPLHLLSANRYHILVFRASNRF